MLDLIPAHFFSDPTKTFLDPCSKSGVFLREIAKRLIKGLESHFPDLQERLNHIFTKQLFGIGITSLTHNLVAAVFIAAVKRTGNILSAPPLTMKMAIFFTIR